MISTPRAAFERADAHARATCVRLRNAFNLLENSAPDWSQPSPVLVGLEIEVPWSSYFPALWDEFGLATHGISGLSPAQTVELTQRCTALEQTLLPRLHATQDCGVPRGNDRYWEFALAPVCDVALLAHQVALLSAAECLPRDRRHSLQITVADMRPSEDLYLLLLALEIRHVESARLQAGLDAACKPIHTGWLRKGRSGIHLKGPADLQHGTTLASELRTLQLPTSQNEFESLLHTLCWGLHCINGSAGQSEQHQWKLLKQDAREAFAQVQLPWCNWGGQQAAPVLDKSAWDRFLSVLPYLRSRLDDWLPQPPPPPSPKLCPSSERSRAFRPRTPI